MTLADQSGDVSFLRRQRDRGAPYAPVHCFARRREFTARPCGEPVDAHRYPIETDAFLVAGDKLSGALRVVLDP